MPADLGSARYPNKADLGHGCSVRVALQAAHGGSEASWQPSLAQKQSRA